MKKREKAKLDNMSMRQLRGIVVDIAEILWPDSDPDAEWDSETIEEVARVLDNHDLQPYISNYPPLKDWLQENLDGWDAEARLGLAGTPSGGNIKLTLGERIDRAINRAELNAEQRSRIEREAGFMKSEEP